MLDHVSLGVKNYDQSLIFYDQTLAILGYQRVFTIDIPEQGIKTAAYGTNPQPLFEINGGGRYDEEIGKARGVHCAFVAPTVESVHAWHAKCLELGGIDNGAPGPRLHYHSGYYGAFIIDWNGWPIEACLHHYIS